MADKKKIKSEASSSSNNVNNGRGESVVVDVGRRRSSCSYCKSGSNTSITHVVGTVEGGRAPTKIKTDLKKPIINLACHPRLAVLYVGYADGLIRAYNIHTYVVLYTLQLDNTIKLLGAGAFAFHQLSNGFLLATDVVHFLLGMCQLRDL